MNWKNLQWNHVDYLQPDYYNKLLKPYVFSKKTDLEIFEEYLSKKEVYNSVLELGCGNGRVTDVFLKKGHNCELHLVDLSEQMLKASMTRFNQSHDIIFHKSDILEFLNTTNIQFDFIYSLWSFSHSLHQYFERTNDTQKSILEIKGILTKFLINNLKKDGTFYLIHFDSCSDEQIILKKQWEKYFPPYKNFVGQSPSYLIMVETLNLLSKDKIVEFEIFHLIGDPITYVSRSEALETFINFHLEGVFNHSNNLILRENVITDLNNYFDDFENEDGTISLKPGCFIIKIKKIK